MRFKLSAAFLGTLFLMLLILNTFPVFITQNQIVSAKRNDMQGKVGLLSTTLAALPVLTTEKISPVISVLDMDNISGRLLITDLNAVVVYDSARLSSLNAKVAVLPEIVTALSGNDVFRSNYKNGIFYSMASSPIVSTDGIKGCVYFYEKDLEEGAFLRRTQVNISKISIAIAFLGIAGAVFFSFIFGKRVNGLLNGIRSVREGEYAHVIELSGEDELSEVAKEFNELSTRLQKTEEVRREFVSNASHELRTPLASIKLLADSVVHTKKIDEKKLKEFLGDISDETDRLKRITEHLLILTRIDSSDSVKFQEVDLRRTIQKAVQNFELLLKQNGVQINCELSDNCIISADCDGAYQVVSNLLENAIKYNKEKNGFVTIRLYRKDNEVILEVSDNGVGIPEEDLPRIFERFYRVDKARSRETGGTGLGLSIVKEWVEDFGGSIRVESVFSKGTTFILTFESLYKDEAGL
ncbi:MAG: ATP-binding protein [Clostridiales bacterium]|nr:ATP-binding protein [Clostridiales bacterium]